MGQINPVIADFRGNADKILDCVRKARTLQADVVLLPEMSLCGYPPLDLLDYPRFVEASLRELRRIQGEAPQDIGVVVGYIDRNCGTAGKALRNVASLIRDGRVIHTQAKSLLPTYDVFDEARYFEPAAERRIVRLNGKKLGIAICEDVWWDQQPEEGGRYPVDPVKDLLDQGAELLLVPSASPYHTGKAATRLALMSRIGRSGGVPAVYANMVGGNDSLIFDGRSMALRADGSLVVLGKAFAEDLVIFDTETELPALEFEEDRYADIEAALCLGLKDYLGKCGFSEVHLGLSGGVDSAVAAVLAVKALGAERVKAFALPSRYSSEASLSDARELCSRLGLQLEVIAIEEPFRAFLKVLEPVFRGREPDIAEENLQARIRGTLLMAYSNKFPASLLLATGNKSELATGYCTLYGDMNGSLGIIGDLFKTEVYALARHLNGGKEIIPESILKKAPSAELRPGQRDQDSLPPYDVLDSVLALYLLENRGREEIVAQGTDAAAVDRILQMVGRAEYKRRQAPPVLKVSPRAFGTGRRMPIARQLFEV